MNGEHHFKVSNGLTKDHKLRGVIQNPDNAGYYFIFVTDDTPEGICCEKILLRIHKLSSPKDKGGKNEKRNNN